MSRRRVSSVHALTIDPDEEPEGAGASAAAAPSRPNRRQSGRKSFGTAYTQKQETAAASTGLNVAGISAMYTTVIKMSAENKINLKNSWTLPLIDHMESLVMRPNAEEPSGKARGGAGAASSDAAGFGLSGSGHASVDAAMLNFQRASCALDASIKIYSYRVDDVWSTSYRVLENLSRSDGGAGTGAGAEGEAGGRGDEGEDGEGGEDEAGGRAGPKGKSAAARARRVNGSATLERNPAAITLAAVDAAAEVDPLFHKMAAEFDAAGAGGMLMNRLTVSGGARLAFDSTDAPDMDSAPGSGYGARGRRGGVALDARVGASVLEALRVSVQASAASGEGGGGGHSSSGSEASLTAAAVAGALHGQSLAPGLGELYSALLRYSTALGLPAPEGAQLSPHSALEAAAAAMKAAAAAVPPPPPPAAGHAPDARAPLLPQQQPQLQPQADAMAVEGEPGAASDAGMPADSLSAAPLGAINGHLDDLDDGDEGGAGGGGSDEDAGLGGAAGGGSWEGLENVQSSVRLSLSGALDRGALGGGGASLPPSPVRPVASPSSQQLGRGRPGGGPAPSPVDSPGRFLELVAQRQREEEAGGGAAPRPPAMLDFSAIDAALYVEQVVPVYESIPEGEGGGGDDDADILPLDRTLPSEAAEAAAVAVAAALCEGGGDGAPPAPHADLTSLASAAAGASSAAATALIAGKAAAVNKHWKFAAAARRAAEAAEAGGADAAAAAATGPPKRGSKKAAAAFAIDFTSPAGAPPHDAFARCRRTLVASSKAAAAASFSSASGGVGAAVAGISRDAEQISAGAVERATAAGAAAFLTPAALWPAELASLRPPPAVLEAALRLSHRPDVALPLVLALRGTSGRSLGAVLAAATAMLQPRAAAEGRAGGRNLGAAGYASAAGGGHYDDNDGVGAGGGGEGGGGYDYLGGGAGDRMLGDDGDDDDGGGGAYPAFPSSSSSAIAAAENSKGSAAAPAFGSEPAPGGPDGAPGENGPPVPASGPVSLIAAGRAVERIRVRYETVAKKVDVRALKDDMWGWLDAAQINGRMGPPREHAALEAQLRVRAGTAGAGLEGTPAAAAAAASAGAAASSSLGDGGVPFTEAIRAMAPGMPEGVSVPFYFITLLHLCNEHGMVLEQGGSGGGVGGTAATGGSECSPAALGDVLIGALKM